MYNLNPDIIFRKEIDGTALLFMSDTGEMFSLNYTSAIIYEQLSHCSSVEQILEKMSLELDELPASAKDDVETFLAQLIAKGFLVVG